MKTSLKSEFASFQTLSRPFGPAQYVKCRRLFLELNSQGFYSGSKRGRKIRRCGRRRILQREIILCDVLWTPRRKHMTANFSFSF